MPVAGFIARLRLIALCGLAAFLAATGTAGARTNFFTLYQFKGSPAGDGSLPEAGLFVDVMNGGIILYGTTAYGGTSNNGTVFGLVPPPNFILRGWSESMSYSFTGGNGGGNPQADLIEDANGNLYGTTNPGVGPPYCPGGSGSCGTVFELTPPASGGVWPPPTVVYDFCTLSACADGTNPVTPLVYDKASGALYGTTFAGGDTSCSSPSGCGTVLELTPPASGVQWAPTVLHTFTGAPNDGATPLAGLIEDANGNLYGTTVNGGSSNFGTVFMLTPPASGGQWTVLYSFTGGSDGGNPWAGLVMDADGNLYGTTKYGGSSPNCPGNEGCGTVFKLTPPATSGGVWPPPTVLYNFCSKTGCVDGSNPVAGLAYDKVSRALFGTTWEGGVTNTSCSAGCGTVFMLGPPNSSGWTETVLHSFTGGNDGGYPWAGLAYDESAGALYGTTTMGGATSCSGGCGVVFAVDAGYALTVGVNGKGKVTTARPPNQRCLPGRCVAPGLPHPISCPGTCDAYFAPGAKVTLAATPARGSTFNGWSGVCAGSGKNNTCTVTMNALRKVSASFK